MLEFKSSNFWYLHWPRSFWLSFGAQTEKMKQGHRGANHPVCKLKDKTVEITSQNHGFKVVEETLPSFLNITHKSLFDGTIEGLEHKSKPIFQNISWPSTSEALKEVT